MTAARAADEEQRERLDLMVIAFQRNAGERPT